MFGINLYVDRNDDSFSIDRALDVFTSGKDMKMSKKEKFLDKMLNSPNFYGFVFVDNNGEKKEKLKKFYKTMSEKENLEVINNTLEDYGLDYPRSAATFLFTVCSYVTTECNKLADSVDADFKSGSIRRSEKEDKMDDIEERFAYAKSINNDFLNSMIKGYAKKMSRKTGLPKEVCLQVVKNVPEKAYITKDSIGQYMNIITDTLYTEIDEYDDVDRIDWENFFKMVIGDEFTKEVAMYLTVESANRIKRTWKNSETVQDVWDSLSAYALETLENSPPTVIDHMIGLYKKIVASMSGDEKNDLRVDLTKLDEDVFPKIRASVDKCYNDIKKAVDIAKGKKDRYKKDGELATLN
jgi:hypothetical protein